jgi:putative transposase
MAYPELATGEGALGFWKALDEMSPATRHQRCTVHKTANALDKMPKSVQQAAKADLREIWTAPDHATAEAAVTSFAEKYGTKYAKAVTGLVKDRDCPKLFSGSHSAMASRSPTRLHKTPPDHRVTQFPA